MDYYEARETLRELHQILLPVGKHAAIAYALADWDNHRTLAADLKAQVAELEAELATDRAVCICGCPISEHESYGEDGESCGHDDHECIRVCPAALQIANDLRQKVTEFSAELLRMGKVLALASGTVK